jgi:hypothetical protein
MNVNGLAGVTQLRGEIHSSRGGKKAYPSFELKDRRPPEAAALCTVLDFKAQIRSGSAARRMGRCGEGGPLRFEWLLFSGSCCLFRADK